MNSINTPILEIPRRLEMQRMEMLVLEVPGMKTLAALVLEAAMVMVLARIGEDWGGLAQQQVSHFHGVVHDITLA